MKRFTPAFSSVSTTLTAAAVVLALGLAAPAAHAQAHTKSLAAHAQTSAAAAPSAPAPQAGAAATTPPPAPALRDPFPPMNPRYFTADAPTVDIVNSFLEALWGYDANRIWRVMAIQKTEAPGVSKVVVFVSDKSPNAKIATAVFFTTPDGKHAIAASSGVIPFGAKPFADARAILQEKANGAWRGAPGKALEFVEFADLQCPHCKEAQSTMDNLVKDFPDAHVVFQPFPLVEVHSSAFKAAAYGVCVQQKNNGDFFKYADAVFDTQDALSSTTDTTVLKAAVLKAGLDPAAIAACADTPATKAIVNADIKLAEDVGVDQTPLLAVDGHLLPITSMSYETLKQIIVYQAQQDGVPTGARADILAPPPPKLQSLPN